MKILLVSILGLASAAAQQCSEGSEDLVVLGLNRFSSSLYKVVAEHATGNAVTSPLGLYIPLGLALMGAGGETARQLSAALFLPPEGEGACLAEGFGALVGELSSNQSQSDGDAVLRLANRLYLQNGFPVEEAFQRTAVDSFRSDVQNLNFADTENARNAINEWVEERTNDLIQNLIPEGFLSAATVLVLVNAVYFSGSWLHPFRAEATTIAPFHVSAGEQVDVSMMHGTFQLGYAALPECNAAALRLPYRDNTYQSRLIILLPNSVDGLEELEEHLGSYDISDISFQTREVTVSLPSFTVESTLPMVDKLQQLGVIDLFESIANLTGISQSADLSVSGVIQKAYVKVDENGTEAAAATAIGVVALSSVVYVNPPIVFNAERPFLFLLLSYDRILFIGRVVNPNE